MPRRATIDPVTPLTSCPQWPTAFDLPVPVVARLDTLSTRGAEAGVSWRRKDVVGMLILFAPEDSMKLGRCIDGYFATGLGPRAELRRRNGRTLMLMLPSPISLRLDALVEQARLDGRLIYRKDLLAALIMQRPDVNSDGIRGGLLQYRTSDAGAAILQGRGPGPVLGTDRPKPGARPMPAAS